MSRLKKLSALGQFPLAAAVTQLQTMIMEKGGSLSDAQSATRVCSLESLDEGQALALHRTSENLTNELRSALEGLGLENLSEAQLEAGAIIALASGNPAEYAHKGYAAVAQISTEGVSVSEASSGGIAGSMDYRGTALPALEAFSEQELRNHLPMSIVYNVQAVRQDRFSEAFYPTHVLTPDQAGLDITVRKFNVYDEVRHGTSGKVTDFKWRNLINAARDPAILANEATEVVPVRQLDNSNAAYFVDAALVAPQTRKINSLDIPTAPLKMGVDLDLLGISQFPGQIGAALTDSTDSLDARVALKNVYLKVQNSDGSVKEVIRFVTGRLPRAQFNKTAEGNFRELGLQFKTSDLRLDADTVTVGNAAPTLLDALRTAGYSLRLSVDVSGSANVETGATRVYSSPITVAGLYDTDGNPVSIESGAGKAIVDGLYGLELVAYDLDARRSNADHRTRGLLLNPTEETERHTIPLGAPISAPSPLGTNRDASDLQALIAATRIRNSNNAVTSLLNYAETLKQYVDAATAKGHTLAIEGVGRHLVTPFFEETDIDLELVVNSVKSHEKAADISAALVNAIRDVAYRMYRDSGYKQALDMVSGGVDEVVKLVIGTDQVLTRFLMVSGDTRTLGIGMEPVVVDTPDLRMTDKIVLAFSRTNGASIDGLSFGAFAWIPELASSIQVTRNGAPVKEATVQPRTRHINTCPVLAVINVKNLNKVLTEKTTVTTTP